MSTVRTELLARLNDGDEEAWNQFSKAFSGYIFSRIVFVGRGRFRLHTREDLSQDVMTKLPGALKSYRPGGGVRFEIWLSTIVRNTINDHYRERGAKRRGGGKAPNRLITGHDETGDAPDPGEETDRSLFRAKVFGGIEAAKRKVDSRKWALYVAKLFEGGISQKRISEIHGVSTARLSEYLRQVREIVASSIRDFVEDFSGTPEEVRELDEARLDRWVGSAAAEFDNALVAIWRRELRDRRMPRPGPDSLPED